MTIQRMDHVGVVVDDLEAATEFFVELGLERAGGGAVEGRWVDRIVGRYVSIRSTRHGGISRRGRTLIARNLYPS